ncbi:MAG: hypothetical protein ABIH11_05305 [Candidatus Altiarchaeota archaeon]
MDARGFVAVFIIFLLSSGGCIMGSSKKEAAPLKYIEPCHIAHKGLQIRVGGSELDPVSMKKYIFPVFVDEFNVPAARDMRETFKMDCYWGKNKGENRDLYYCGGRYRAPVMDESRVIKFHMWKVWKIGFGVEKHDIGTWIDSSGKIHNEDAVYYLTVNEVSEKCHL